MTREDTINRNPISLCEYVESIVLNRRDEKYYLFIDEIQLTAYKNLDVYIAGSNSKGLSKDIATEFRGRGTQIRMFPLSFAEYYAYVGGEERRAYGKHDL